MKRTGFTLAEVLVTLVIIGVVVAITIPALMQNSDAHEYRSGLKKAITSLNQALQLHYALESLGPSDYEDAPTVVNELFRSRMKVLNDDAGKVWNIVPDAGGTASTRPVCGSDNKERTWTTQDGIKYCIDNFNKGNTDSGACNKSNTQPCGTAGNIYIDVNGDKKPNKMTTNAKRPRDIYRATLYNQQVIPYGDAAQGIMYDK